MLMSTRKWLHRRAHRRGIDGHKRIGRQRMIALLMIGTGFTRVVVWTILLTLYLIHVTFARSLFASVSFVAVLSVLALMLTDWGQVAASLAQLSASDAHHDAEAGRRELGIDFSQVENDIALLAKLQPGPESDELVLSIRKRLQS
jgi:hypothetical protein